MIVRFEGLAAQAVSFQSVVRRAIGIIQRLGENMLAKPIKHSLVPALLLLVYSAAIRAADPFVDAEARVADIDWLITQIETRYAYLPERHLDLAQMRALYEPRARAAQTREAMVQVVESVVAELHDDHVTLGTNTPSSPQLIPTGTDLWAEMRNGRALLVEVRPGSAAAKAGISPGDVIVSVGGIPIGQAIENSQPKTLTAVDAEAVNFTLRKLLAGTHDTQRRLVVKDSKGKTRAVNLEPVVPAGSDELVSWRWLDGKTGYIRLENSLGDSDTVAAFDQALDGLGKAKSLIIDLRNTPSGGNTDVAEPIMGRFISTPAAYQRIFEPGTAKRFPQDSWLKTLEPRPPQVTAKLVVLVNHWTGSMGEGMAIGFDAIGRAKIVGTPMARLCGGTEGLELPNTVIPIHIPTYRLYHVNGTPRENFTPSINVDLTKSSAADDPVLARGLDAAKPE
jgi:carboxyl-terminal processing protease